MSDFLDDRARRLATDLSRVPVPSASSVRRAAVRRKRIRVGAAAGAVLVAAGIAGAVTRLGSNRHPTTQVVTSTPTTATTSSTTTAPAVGPTKELPISVESDSEMKAAGNDGPSSSILLPTACRQTGSTVTAEGSYTNGGFVPNVYNRYGDSIVMYVFAAPSAGYPQGVQLGVSAINQSPSVGSPAPWQVSLTVASGIGTPARCVVAAQPTHDVQLAP